MEKQTLNVETTLLYNVDFVSNSQLENLLQFNKYGFYIANILSNMYSC